VDKTIVIAKCSVQSLLCSEHWQTF